jgi:hypothetical protein
MPIDQNFAASCLTIFAKKRPSGVARNTEDALKLKSE